MTVNKPCLLCEKIMSGRPSVIRKKKYCSKLCVRNSTLQTDIELKMRVALEGAEIPHQTQYQIGFYFADFALIKPKLVIEVDGSYWHQNKERDRKRDRFINNVNQE